MLDFSGCVGCELSSAGGESLDVVQVEWRRGEAPVGFLTQYDAGDALCLFVVREGNWSSFLVCGTWGLYSFVSWRL